MLLYLKLHIGNSYLLFCFNITLLDHVKNILNFPMSVIIAAAVFKMVFTQFQKKMKIFL